MSRYMWILVYVISLVLPPVGILLLAENYWLAGIFIGLGPVLGHLSGIMRIDQMKG